MPYSGPARNSDRLDRTLDARTHVGQVEDTVLRLDECVGSGLSSLDRPAGTLCPPSAPGESPMIVEMGDGDTTDAVPTLPRST